MKSAVLSTSLFFLFMQLIVPAYNTECIQCIGQNTKTCKKQEKEQCPENSECITISEVYSVAGKVMTSISRHCAMNLPCNTFMHAHINPDLYIYLNLKCCKGDLCNTDPYDMPSNHTKERGMLCPTCAAYGTLEECNATRSTTCWAETDQCINFRATVLRPDNVVYNISAKGCTSANACLYDYSQTAFTRLLSVVQYTCYTPTLPPPQEKKPTY